jgi:hypothetical protein
MTAPLTPPTFDALGQADLDQVYHQGREEVLRDQVFRILLARADTVEKLEQLAFGDAEGLARWTRKELIEISNRFRLLSSPENEIRLYRECQDELFRQAPRVREFYVLALNKVGRPAEAIHEASRIIAEGGGNGLLWGTLGEAYSAKMHLAEQLAAALTAVNNQQTMLNEPLLARCAAYFPDLDLSAITVARARALREENLAAALCMFEHGFRESGASFSGLGWLLRTIDRLADLITTRGQLQQQMQALDEDDALRLRLTDAEIMARKQEINHQLVLINFALTAQGGWEALDYWTNAGIVLCLAVQGVDEIALRSALVRLFATVDADFKLATTLAELRRLRDQFAIMGEVEQRHGRVAGEYERCAQAATVAIKACEDGRARFKATGRAANAPEHNDGQGGQGDRAGALGAFLSKTINFCALTGSLVPVLISGTIGRVGARVPDLVINRNVQEDLADLVTTNVLQPLTLAERADPRAVIDRIQQVVGAGLRVGDLQDLQSPAHEAFDLRSNGLIALSGVDELRRHSRTTTDLTATLLMQNGDCRETMYLNGALFACWQQMEVKKRIAKAMLCLELDYEAGFQTIVTEEIPALLRYQLRGGQVALYVESIAMRGKYGSERVSATDPTALLRLYGVEELLARRPLTPYELATAKLKLTYAGGATTWLEPRHPTSGRWQPMDHLPTGGAPLLPTSETGSLMQVQLLNLVEEHAMTFLFDTQAQTVEFCDGFYNQLRYASPYSFGAGLVNVAEISAYPHLLRAGERTLVHPDGARRPHPVFLQFLPFSQTEYESALTEGDIPDTIHLMGRTFSGDLTRERRRLQEGASPIPVLLERVHGWQAARQQSPPPDRRQTEQQLARFMLDLARERPELVSLQDVTSDEPLIREGSAPQHVYLVLSGQLYVSRQGQRLRDAAGNPVIVTAGAILGEIALLGDGMASATVSGDAVVLGINSTVLRQQLTTDAAFRTILKQMAAYRNL